MLEVFSERNHKGATLPHRYLWERKDKKLRYKHPIPIRYKNKKYLLLGFDTSYYVEFIYKDNKERLYNINVPQYKAILKSICLDYFTLKYKVGTTKVYLDRVPKINEVCLDCLKEFDYKKGRVRLRNPTLKYMSPFFNFNKEGILSLKYFIESFSLRYLMGLVKSKTFYVKINNQSVKLESFYDTECKGLILKFIEGKFHLKFSINYISEDKFNIDKIQVEFIDKSVIIEYIEI